MLTFRIAGEADSKAEYPKQANHGSKMETRQNCIMLLIIGKIRICICSILATHACTILSKL